MLEPFDAVGVWSLDADREFVPAWQEVAMGAEDDKALRLGLNADTSRSSTDRWPLGRIRVLARIAYRHYGQPFQLRRHTNVPWQPPGANCVDGERYFSLNPHAKLQLPGLAPPSNWPWDDELDSLHP